MIWQECFTLTNIEMEKIRLENTFRHWTSEKNNFNVSGFQENIVFVIFK
jgi:hypothetical protein